MKTSATTVTHRLTTIQIELDDTDLCAIRVNAGGYWNAAQHLCVPCKRTTGSLILDDLVEFIIDTAKGAKS